jgi:diacylglycerol kinase family enzyme
VVDGEQRECHSVLVCNVSRYGGGFVLAEGADMFSPGFHVVCVNSPARSAYLRLALKVLRGSGIAGPGVEILTGRELSFSGGRAIQADGDFVGRGPASIRAVAGFARLIV